MELYEIPLLRFKTNGSGEREKIIKILDEFVEQGKYGMKQKIMAVSYNKLWKLLVDKKMSKLDLRKKAEIAPNTMTKLCHDEEVSLTILRIFEEQV